MKKIELRNYKDFLDNTIFIVSLLLGYVLQTSLRFINIKGITPIILLSIVISISMLQNMIISCIYSLIGGLLCDMAMNCIVGVSVLWFVIIAVVVNILTIWYFKINMVNFIIFLTVSLFIEYSIILLYKFILLGIADINLFMLYTALPSILFTILLGPFVFIFFLYVNNIFIHNYS